jgi:nicotinamidase-related amidase
MRPTILPGEFGIALVDLQDYFLYKVTEFEGKSASECLLGNALSVVEFGVRHSLPIYLVRDFNLGDINPEITVLLESYGPKANIEKDSADGFDGTNFEREINRYFVKNLLYAGISKTGCMKATISSGISHGYNSFTSPDLMNRKGEINDWYKTNTNFFRDHKKLISFLEKKVLK